jgi:hypothetical protein
MSFNSSGVAHLPYPSLDMAYKAKSVKTVKPYYSRLFCKSVAPKQRWDKSIKNADMLAVRENVHPGPGGRWRIWSCGP